MLEHFVDIMHERVKLRGNLHVQKEMGACVPQPSVLGLQNIAIINL